MKPTFYFFANHAVLNGDYDHGLVFYSCWADATETEVSPSACIFMIP